MPHLLTIIAALLAIAAEWPTVTAWPVVAVPAAWPTVQVQEDLPAPPLPAPKQLPRRTGHWESRGIFGRQQVWVQDTDDSSSYVAPVVTPGHFTEVAPSYSTTPCKT